jgi:hypothetical protein
MLSGFCATSTPDVAIPSNPLKTDMKIDGIAATVSTVVWIALSPSSPIFDRTSISNDFLCYFYSAEKSDCNTLGSLVAHINDSGYRDQQG